MIQIKTGNIILGIGKKERWVENEERRGGTCGVSSFSSMAVCAGQASGGVAQGRRTLQLEGFRRGVQWARVGLLGPAPADPPSSSKDEDMEMGGVKPSDQMRRRS